MPSNNLIIIPCSVPRLLAWRELNKPHLILFEPPEDYASEKETSEGRETLGLNVLPLN